MPLAEVAVPACCPAKPAEELLTGISARSGLDTAGLARFAAQPGALLTSARLVFPRSYGANEGEKAPASWDLPSRPRPAWWHCWPDRSIPPSF